MNVSVEAWRIAAIVCIALTDGDYIKSAKKNVKQPSYLHMRRKEKSMMLVVLLGCASDAAAAGKELTIGLPDHKGRGQGQHSVGHHAKDLLPHTNAKSIPYGQDGKSA